MTEYSLGSAGTNGLWTIDEGPMRKRNPSLPEIESGEMDIFDLVL